MTIEEAIKHCEEVIEAKEKISIYTPFEMVSGGEDEIIACRKCAEEHRQLAEWLKELKQYREWLESFNSDSATECFTAVRELRSMVRL